MLGLKSNYSVTDHVCQLSNFNVSIKLTLSKGTIVQLTKTQYSCFSQRWLLESVQTHVQESCSGSYWDVERAWVIKYSRGNDAPGLIFLLAHTIWHPYGWQCRKQGAPILLLLCSRVADTSPPWHSWLPLLFPCSLSSSKTVNSSKFVIKW